MFCFTILPTTELYTLSLHDALPISVVVEHARLVQQRLREQQRAAGVAGQQHARRERGGGAQMDGPGHGRRSEEHTSELQSLTNLVCRLLLEKKNGGGTYHSGRGESM